MSKLIVKRSGHVENYDEKKLYGAIYSVCLSVREPVGVAELVAERVVADMGNWLSKKHEVTSNDIRRKASEFLHSYNVEASHLYHKQRVLH